MTEPAAEFLEIFRDEANERLDTFVKVLLAFEEGRAEPGDIDSLFRDAHTIKGAAGMLGLEHVQALAHRVEDVLARVREAGTFAPALTGPLLRAADGLRAQVDGAGEASPELLAELDGCLNGALALGPDEALDTIPAVERRSKPQLTIDRRAIRVPAEKLDRLLDLVGETVLHRRRLEHALADAETEQRAKLADELGFGERLLGELQDAAIQTRTLPLRSITSPFPRAVRDLATASEKEVELVLAGVDTELDRVILEGLAEPLVHLLRNAVAHGIESPAERELAGKPRQARIELTAEQRGGIVSVTVADDGRGVSAEVLAQARREGSLVAVLTRPGFSTSDEVSGLAGRGVGLDAVKAHVEQFAGDIEIESEPGRGTRVTLLLPLTLALLTVLLVERGRHIFGLPLSSVQEAVTVTETLSLAGDAALELRGQSIPLADLADVVGAEAPAPPARPPALIISASGQRVAAICDRLVGEEDVVVKALGLLASVPGYLGAAILGDGRIALLLDPTSIVRAAGRRRALRTEPSLASAAAVPKVLVVEDSFTVRELQRSVLEAAGYRVETACNGRDALERLSGEGDIGLVLTDVDMPEMDGFALTEAIRVQPRHSSLPVIVVTSRASDDDRRRGIAAGADAYMVKQSFDQQLLLETVGHLVGR